MDWLGDQVALGKVEMGAGVRPGGVPERWHQRPDCVFEHLPLFSEPNVEGMELRGVGSFSHPEFDSTARNDVEGRDLFGDPPRVVGGEVFYPVADSDLVGPGRDRGQEDLGRRIVAVLLEEVVLRGPDHVIAESIGQDRLLDRLVEGANLRIWIPRLGYLDLEEQSEFHLPTS